MKVAHLPVASRLVLHAPAPRPRSVRRSSAACLFGGVSASDMQSMTREIQALRSDVSGLKGLVAGAVAVNAYAYLAPLVAFFALASFAGFFEKPK